MSVNSNDSAKFGKHHHHRHAPKSDSYDKLIVKKVELDENVSEFMDNNNNAKHSGFMVKKVDNKQLALAPKYVRDYEIKKPDEKEPEFKMRDFFDKKFGFIFKSNKNNANK